MKSPSVKVVSVTDTSYHTVISPSIEYVMNALKKVRYDYMPMPKYNGGRIPLEDFLRYMHSANIRVFDGLTDGTAGSRSNWRELFEPYEKNGRVFIKDLVHERQSSRRPKPDLNLPVGFVEWCRTEVWAEPVSMQHDIGECMIVFGCDSENELVQAYYVRYVGYNDSFSNPSVTRLSVDEFNKALTEAEHKGILSDEQYRRGMMKLRQREEL